MPFIIGRLMIGGGMQKVKVRFAYKAGFRRLWLVSSIIWLIGTIVVTYDYRDGGLQTFFIAGVLPVVILYLLGVAFVWVIEGFAKADR